MFIDFQPQHSNPVKADEKTVKINTGQGYSDHVASKFRAIFGKLGGSQRFINFPAKHLHGVKDEPKVTTQALNEEGGTNLQVTTQALNEEGGTNLQVTTQALNEEGGTDLHVTTQALGEEGGTASR